MINWNTTYAAIWRQHKECLRAVVNIDPIRLANLLGIDEQKQQVVQNTLQFLDRQPANNVLLWGSRGTGKSSLVKALLNEYKDRDLRLIQVDKDDLIYLPEIVDDIRDLEQRFIIYCDDLSFDTHDKQYKSLKSVLEGSIELPPDNVLIYATSNRRNLMPEQMSDNLNTQLINGEVHYSDMVEEKISLSDRFGLRLGFYPQSAERYLAIVDNLFSDLSTKKPELHQSALDYAHQRGSKNGRTAKQFYNYFMSSINNTAIK